MPQYPTYDGNGQIIIPAPGLTNPAYSAQYIDNATSFVGEIEEIARLGVAGVTMQAEEASQNISTGLMRDITFDSAGGSLTLPGHPIAGYDYGKMLGDNDCELFVIHESKFKKLGSGTLDTLSMYKPAIDEIEGTVTDFIILDGDIDFSGISGTVTNKYLIQNPREEHLIHTAGGILQDAELILGDITLTVHDSGKHFLTFAGTDITVTHPAQVGYNVTIIKGDANVVNHAVPGGVSLLNKDSHTKNGALYGEVRVRCTTSNTVFLSGDTGA